MVNRRVLLNIGFFIVVFVVMCAWAVANIVTVDQIDQPYAFHAEFTAASGVMPNAEVAYLGVHYGRVSTVDRLPGAVRMTLKIDKGKRIPKGSIARIFRKSAIGEPYIDFNPPSGYRDGGPYIAKGDLVPVSQTQVPLEFSELLRAANALLANVDASKAGDLIHELSVGLNGRADSLRSLTSSFDTLTASFAAKTDVLDRLATNNTAITKVLADHANDLGQSLTNLRQLADTLAAANGDTANVLDRGTQLIGELANLVSYGKADLDCTLKTLTNVTALAVSHLPGTDTLLTKGPQAFNQTFSTLDIEPDGPWVRVNLLVDPTSPPRQYIPPLTLPAHRDVPACTSSLTPASGKDFVPAQALAASQSGGGGMSVLPATGGVALAALVGALLAVAIALRTTSLRARSR